MEFRLCIVYEYVLGECIVGVYSSMGYVFIFGRGF